MMIFADKESLHIDNGDFTKMLEQLSLGEIGLYLTIKALSIDIQHGIDEKKILELSIDGVEETRKLLEGLIKKDYVQRIEGLIKVTPREIE